MIKKTTTYTDFNGMNRVEDCYFNLTEAELVEMMVGMDGDVNTLLDKIIKEKDPKQIYAYFKQLVLMSYGEKSPDGRRFLKSEDIRNGFAPTEACSNIILELVRDPKAAADFVKGIIPANLASKVEAQKDIVQANN